MSDYPLVGFPTFSYASENWILDEDRALRDHLKGVVASDYQNQQRPVEVWFGHPDQELREQKYPYITVDLVNIQEGIDRVHRGDYYVKEVPAWWNMKPLETWQIGYLMEMPTPVDLDYQVSTWARNPRHDRQILQQLITGGRTTLRGGLLFTAEGKSRRLDFLGHSKRDMVDADGKRLFNNVFRIRVSSEVPWHVIDVNFGSGYQPFGTVQSVNLRIEALLETYGLAYDETLLHTALVDAVDAVAGTADVTFTNGPSYLGVPIIKGLQAVGIGDSVTVLQDAAYDQTPVDESGYRRVVVAVLERAAQ